MHGGLILESGAFSLALDTSTMPQLTASLPENLVSPRDRPEVTPVLKASSGEMGRRATG